MSPVPPRRVDLELFDGYHSAQVPATVRLNANESPFPPPERWRADFGRAVAETEFHRYPDRGAAALRHALGTFHGVAPDEVFCANGSNEALQCLLLAFGGPGRRVVTFEPTYALHAHISRVTGTEVVEGARTDDFTIDGAHAGALVADRRPAVTFLCSPNNPTGRTDPPELVASLLQVAPGLVVVDEAYGQFASTSALDLRRPATGDPGPPDGTRALVVARTFSKTWALAGARLGYLIADPAVVAACEQVVLPYHLSTLTQVAGVLALQFADEMRQRVARVSEERGRIAGALGDLAVDSWPSDANFILFRPRAGSGTALWRRLLDHSVLVRDCSSWPGLVDCLRVTVGTPEENDRFLGALAASL